MKKVEECESLTDVRQAIDEIDSKIISLFSERAFYVNKAAEFKNDLASIKAEDRVKSMIEIRRQWAQEKNLHPDFIENLFRYIIGYFTNKEIKHFSHLKLPD